MKDTFGVEGLDPQGGTIGTPKAKRYWKGWSPFDPAKRTLCGRVHHYKFNGNGGENDWNIFVIPASGFEAFIEVPKASADPGGLWDCDGQDDCLEVELEPHKSYHGNRFFHKDGSTSLSGATICTYGPWVADLWHGGGRPEIHPAELFWWKNNDGLFLMMLQDASDRYGRASNFDVANPAPGWWRPWSGYRKQGEFRIAFRVNPGQTPQVLRISEVDPPVNVITQNDGLDHTFSYDGKVVLTVEEPRSGDNLAVNFVEVCRTSQNWVQGYVSLKGTLGTDDKNSSMVKKQGRGGYLVLRVDPPSSPPSIQAPAPIAVSSTKRAQERSPSQEPLGLHFSVDFEKAERSTADGGSDWPALLKAIASVAGVRPPAKTMHVREWLLNTRPIYGPLRDGEVSPEGKSEVAETINAHLAKPDRAAIAADFGSAEPFERIRWEFKARNLVTQETVPVYSDGRGRDTDIRVKIEATPLLEDGALRILFPAEGLFELSSDGILRDRSGRQGRVQHSVWSYGLSGATQSELARALLASLPEIASVPRSPGLSEPSVAIGPVKEPLREPWAQRDRVLRLAALRAAEDGWISVGELQTLIRTARALPVPPRQ